MAQTAMAEAISIWLPLGFDQWPPLLQGVTLFLLTFVSEDLTTVSAAFLAQTGEIHWHAGYWGCYLGIWFGDSGLYWLARGVGYPLLKRPWARKLIKAESVNRCEKWFSKQGSWVLVGSRFVPGMRLPSYLAAGFLRYSFPRFLLATGIVGLIWTSLIFFLARTFGTTLLQWLNQWKLGGWGVLAGIVLLFLFLRLGGRLLDRRVRLRLGAAVGRWTRWEFWPPWLFYPPVGIWCLWMALKYRGLTLPSAANPGIFTGGIVGESKDAMLRQLTMTCPEFTAEAHRIDCNNRDERLARLKHICEQTSLSPPFIIKPDIGQRGEGVKLIRTMEQAADCVTQTGAPLLVQRYAEGPHEAGVFYYRFPHEEKGRLFAITRKEFPCLTGDGESSIESLIWHDCRARYVAGKYLERLGERRHEVLPAGERLKLVEAGNHAQGCIFLDGASLGTPELESRIDEISRTLNGFFFGRYDVRYSSEEELRAGKGFKIIELNGAASEATCIYDARNSLRTAYRILFRQWEIAFAIGAANRARGVQPTSLTVVWQSWRAYLRMSKSYPVAD